MSAARLPAFPQVKHRAAGRNRTDDLFITSEFWRLSDLRHLRANALSSCENAVLESLEEARRVWPKGWTGGRRRRSGATGHCSTAVARGARRSCGRSSPHSPGASSAR